jgi:hypothetical protein
MRDDLRLAQDLRELAAASAPALGRRWWATGSALTSNGLLHDELLAIVNQRSNV